MIKIIIMKDQIIIFSWCESEKKNKGMLLKEKIKNLDDNYDYF